MSDTAPGKHKPEWGLAIAFAWFAVFAAAVAAYWPGLNGPFLLDDFGSIAALGKYGGVHDWESFRAFVFGGTAGPTGRPLSLLTFLIDANDWPAESFPFKRTNLIIHLVSGVLLALVVRQVLRLLDYDEGRARWVTLVTTAGWLLHPFLVSTTLYAVQRMAQLSTLFMFAGIAAYLYGRVLIDTNRTRAYAIMSASIAAFTFLAMISKENGILLPVLIGVVEITVLASQSRYSRLNGYWMLVFLVVPSLVIAAYLGKGFFRDSFFDVVPPREFSVYERVLTQPRILMDYLQHWFIPRLYTTGVFQDHFIKSTGILSPVTTALSFLFHGAAIAIALVKRRHWPLVSLAILFFYAGHLLESTVLNLELYFEHRNYLPASLLFLPVVVFLIDRLRPTLFAIVAIALGVMLAGFMRYSATIWSSYPDIVAASARQAPTSARAQAQYAVNLYALEEYDEALAVLDRAIDAIPVNKPHLEVNRLVMLCELHQLESAEFERVGRELSESNYDPRMVGLYSELANVLAKQSCPSASMRDFRAVMEGMLKIPHNGNPERLAYSQIKYFIGFSHAVLDEPADAIKAFLSSLRSRPGAGHAMQMAAVLASNGHFAEALEISELAKTQIEADRHSTLGGQRVSEADINAFQKTVREDIENRQGADISRPAP